MKGARIFEVLRLAPNRHIDAMELLYSFSGVLFFRGTLFQGYSFSGVLFLRDNHAMK